MNQRGVDALVAAHEAGVRQIKGKATDGQGGFCAAGVLVSSWAQEMGVPLRVDERGRFKYVNEEDNKKYGLAGVREFFDLGYIANIYMEKDNDLGMTFLQIAQKYGPKVSQSVVDSNVSQTSTTKETANV